MAIVNIKNAAAVRLMENFVFVNNAFITQEKASLLITDLAIQRGYGIFDFFKTLNHHPVFLDDHLNRFYHSAQQMRLPVDQSHEALKTLLHELMQRNNMPDAGIRLTLTGGYSADGYALDAPNLVITQKPLQMPSEQLFEQGIRLVTHAHQRQMPAVKTIDYLMAIWLQPFIHQNGADDVLYHNNRIITECPRANFFIITAAGEVVTPAHNILQGIIRMKTLQLAHGTFATAVRDVTLGDLEHAQEAFITSTTKHIMPVVQINGIAVGNGRPGAVTRRLSTALQEILAEYGNAAVEY